MRLTTLSAVLALAFLAGCGIKPSEVDPPPGVDKDAFPQTYPNPKALD